jgi:hypothetical protein
VRKTKNEWKHIEGLKKIKRGNFESKSFLVYDLARCLEAGEFWKSSIHILGWCRKIKSYITGSKSLMQRQNNLIKTDKTKIQK